jgi:hypothetical protein
MSNEKSEYIIKFHIDGDTYTNKEDAVTKAKELLAKSYGNTIIDIFKVERVASVKKEYKVTVYEKALH